MGNEQPAGNTRIAESDRGTMTERSDLNGHLAFAARLCFDCEGPLIDETGTYSERLFEGRRTFAAIICNKCRRERDAKENAELEASKAVTARARVRSGKSRKA